MTDPARESSYNHIGIEETLLTNQILLNKRLTFEDKPVKKTELKPAKIYPQYPSSQVTSDIKQANQRNLPMKAAMKSRALPGSLKAEVKNNHDIDDVYDFERETIQLGEDSREYNYALPTEQIQNKYLENYSREYEHRGDSIRRDYVEESFETNSGMTMREDELGQIERPYLSNSQVQLNIPKTTGEGVKQQTSQSGSQMASPSESYHLKPTSSQGSVPVISMSRDTGHNLLERQNNKSSCVKEILENLDIMKRTTVMKMPWTKETVEEDDIFRAQALANLDAFFYANEDDVKAHHVMGDIDLIPGGRPFKCRPRRYSQVQQAFLEAKTGIMVEEGRLEHSTSDWSHGLVLVPYDDRITAFMEEFGENAMTEILKKENRVRVSTFFRLCLDLRQLNLQTVPDVYPLPRIDDLLDHIPRQIDRFSISDLADAFFLVELKSDKRHLTSFRTHNRQLQFAALPQGFINSPAIFSRFVDRVFNGLDRTRFSWYMDDTLNHSKGFMSHYFTQREAYNRLRIGNVTMKLSKTHINYDMMKFLGHLLFYDGRTPATDSVEAIAEWADPKDTTAVRSFLGATLYYREYIHQYSELAMPLYALTKKGVVVVDVCRSECCVRSYNLLCSL